jgi:hypothetical protein
MIRKLVGLAALGGFLYAHKKRGGQLTIDSFKQTARGLVDDVKARAMEMKSKAEQKLAETREESKDWGEQSTSAVDQVTGYGSAGYGYGADRDLNRR